MSTLNASRKSSFGENVFKFKQLAIELCNVEDESAYLDKLELIETNINLVLNHKRAKLNSKTDDLLRAKDSANNNIEHFNKENVELHKQVHEMEAQHDFLQTEYKKCSDKKASYINDITRMRRDNTKEFDTRMHEIARQDKQTKNLKKELFLIINILKTRIVNIDTCEQENIIKGYLIDVDARNLSYIEIDRRTDIKIRAVTYWNQMRALHLNKNYK